MAAASRVVRQSKFRHVFGEASKPEAHYQDLDLSVATGDHNYIRCNGKFFSVAVRGGGGPVLALPYSLTGKLPRGYPIICGHSAPVYDTAWNPFDDNMLATASDDTTIKLWHIPDGGLTENMKDPVSTLHGHGKQVSLLQWHPTAAGVLASAGKDPSVRVWDVASGSTKVVLEGFGGIIQDIAWSGDGSLLASSAKDKVARLHDPRSAMSGAASVASEWTPHEGGKAFKLVFLGDRGQLLTVGFTRQSKREFKIWDVKNLASPLSTQEIDQAAGVMMPYYDDDTRMLYLTGKGDGNVRYFELVDEAPYVHFLSEHRTNVSTKGADFLPKRACNPLRCEVARMLKLTGDTVEPLSFIVPRKSEAFQDDLFPDCYAGKPALSADQWFSGKNVAAPRMSMDPAKGGVVHTPVAAAKPLTVPQQSFVARDSTGGAASPQPVARSTSAVFTPPPVIPEEVSAVPAKETSAAASGDKVRALEARIADVEARMAKQMAAFGSELQGLKEELRRLAQ